MRRKRTLKDYAQLFRNALHLFPPGPNSPGVRVTLFPNGDRELWIQGTGAKGYRITAGEGPAGLSLHISTFVGGPPISLSGNEAVTYDTFAGPDMRHLDLCQYNSDDKSQAFKAWYQGDVATRGTPPAL